MTLNPIPFQKTIGRTAITKKLLAKLNEHLEKNLTVLPTITISHLKSNCEVSFGASSYQTAIRLNSSGYKQFKGVNNYFTYAYLTILYFIFLTSKLTYFKKQTGQRGGPQPRVKSLSRLASVVACRLPCHASRRHHNPPLNSRELSPLLTSNKLLYQSIPTQPPTTNHRTIDFLYQRRKFHLPL